MSTHVTNGQEIDLGEPVGLRSVRCIFADPGLRSFVVEASLDGHRWLTVDDHSTGTPAQVVSAAASGVFREVRLRGQGELGPVQMQVGTAVEGADLTRDCRADASSHLRHHGPDQVLSEDVSGSWCPAPEDPAPWLELRLPDASRAVVLEVTAAEPGPPPGVCTSSDGQQWTRLPAAEKSVLTSCHRLEPASGWVRLESRAAVAQVRLFGWAGQAGPQEATSADLAAGCALRATSSAPGHLPVSVLSEDQRTWCPQEDDPEPWLTLDLGHECDVDWALAETTGGLPPSVSSSVDGLAWSPLIGGPTSTPARFVRVGQVDGELRRLQVRGHGSPLRHRWWEVGGPVARYFPKQYGVSLGQVEAELPELQRRGFGAIELAGVKQGPPSAFAGLGATDNFAVDQRVGTLAELRQLIAVAHRHGIRVVVFENLGYAHSSAPDFRNAVQRFTADPQADSYPFLLASENRGERWQRDSETGVWYFAYWGEDLPSYDWSDLRWRLESRRILRFWLDQGVDGLGIDAPAAYPGIDADAEREYIGEVLATASVWGFAEGVRTRPQGELQDVYQRMVAEQAFSVILDLTISVWHRPADNRLVPAIVAEDPDGLEQLLRTGRDVVAAADGVIIEAPAWEADLREGRVEEPVPADRRLLEIAYLACCGSFFYLTCGVHTYRAEVDTIPGWEPAQRAALDAILTAVSGEAALGPSGLRIALPTSEPRHVAWWRSDRSGALRSLVLMNFAAKPETIRVDLSGFDVAPGPTLDLLNGGDGPAIVDDRLEAELGSRGYTVLAVG